jgi:anti-sigma B factor antagonist
MRKAHAKASTGGDARRLVLENDLTVYNAPEHKRALMDALDQAKVIELDLAKVGEIDSAGLQVLLLAKRESLASGKELRILRHSPPVQELMEFFNVASYFGDPLVIPAGHKA